MAKQRQTTNNEKIMDNEIRTSSKNIELKHAVIVILFCGEKIPKHCSQMPRYPEKELHIPINENFWKVYFSVIKENASMEDGAILIQINRTNPIIRGFSYRIYPPDLGIPKRRNLGSGYNSSIDFSMVGRVKCVYFANNNGVTKFVRGREIKL